MKLGNVPMDQTLLCWWLKEKKFKVIDFRKIRIKMNTLLEHISNQVYLEYLSLSIDSI